MLFSDWLLIVIFNRLTNMATYRYNPEDDFVVAYFFESQTQVIPMQVPKYLAARLSSTDTTIREQTIRRLNQEFYDVSGIIAITAPKLNVESSPSSSDSIATDTDIPTAEKRCYQEADVPEPGPSVKKAKRPITLHTDDSSFDLGFNAHIEDGDEQMPAKGTLATPAKPKQTLVPLRDDPFEFIFTAPIDEQMPVKTKSGPPTKAKRPSTLPRDDPSFDLGFNSPIEDGNEQLPAKKTSATPAKPKQTIVPPRDDPFEFIFTAPIDEQMPVKTTSGPPTKVKRTIVLPRDDPSFDLGFNTHIEDDDKQMPAKETSAPSAKPKRTIVPPRDDPFEFIFTAPIEDDDEQMPTENKTDYHSWTEADVLLLLDLRKKMREEFQSTKTHAVLWGRIKKELEKNGVEVTVKQASSKFKSLKKDFKAVTDHNNISGNSKKNFKHMDYFVEMFGRRAATEKPSHVVDSLPCTQETKVTKTVACESSRKKNSKKSTPDKLESFINETREYRERQEVFQQQQAAANAKQHEDRLDIMKEFIKIMARTVDKKD